MQRDNQQSELDFVRANVLARDLSIFIVLRHWQKAAVMVDVMVDAGLT